MNLSFCLAINCFDGRVQEPLINYMKNKYSCAYVTMITEPGPVQFIVDVNANPAVTENIHHRINVSLKVHNPKVLAVVAHEECLGNPLPNDIQIKQIKTAHKLLAEKYKDRSVIGLWVDLNSQVHEIIS